MKTRLARALGDERAARLYEAFLRDTLSACAALEGVRRVLCFTPPEAADWFAALDPHAERLTQPAGDLGARLAHAFEHAFATGSTAVAAIGSDTPHLGAPVWRAALARLAPGRVVLGPTEDGGYYFVGLGDPRPGLFEDVDWSTPRVLLQTRERAKRLGLDVELLALSFDVDEPSDLARLRELLEANPEACPATRRDLTAAEA